MHLIGINGFKRSGKGTVANIVSSIYGDGEANVLQVGFADKLKILGAKALGFTDKSDEECIALMDEAKESWVIDIAAFAQEESGLNYSPGRISPITTTIHPVDSLTGRQYLQNLGNEARNVFGDTFWIDMVLPDPVLSEGWEDAAQAALLKRYATVDCICITDLRYPNEAERIKALGGVVWEVLRPGVESDGHASEIPLPRDLVDLQLSNGGSLDELERAVETAMDTL